VASDRVAAVPAVAAAVAELYGADPDVFTERRKALAAAAREAGDKQSAAAITALRKPTRAAWVVNQLARTDPDAAARMAALAADLRAAEQGGDGRRLRELSAERGSLLDGLVAQALAAAGTPDPPPTLRAEVTDTLTAALADPATAADFAAGRLTKVPPIKPPTRIRIRIQIQIPIRQRAATMPITRTSAETTAPAATIAPTSNLNLKICVVACSSARRVGRQVISATGH